MEQRRKLVESERRRLVDRQQVLTVERALVLIGAIAGIIKAHVKDRATLAAISADLERLVQQPECARRAFNYVQTLTREHRAER